MPFGQNAAMRTPATRFPGQFGLINALRALFVLALNVLPWGCKAMPYEGPGAWYVGKATVSGDGAMFGGGGDTSIMWMLPAGTTDWVWRVSTGPSTREWEIGRAHV